LGYADFVKSGMIQPSAFKMEVVRERKTKVDRACEIRTLLEEDFPNAKK